MSSNVNTFTHEAKSTKSTTINCTKTCLIRSSCHAFLAALTDKKAIITIFLQLMSQDQSSNFLNESPGNIKAYHPSSSKMMMQGQAVLFAK